jgi:hypothetical protein
MIVVSIRPCRTARMSAMHSINSSRVRANNRPLGIKPNEWPDRPIRCKNVAMDLGEPTWITRSM